MTGNSNSVLMGFTLMVHSYFNGGRIANSSCSPDKLAALTVIDGSTLNITSAKALTGTAGWQTSGGSDYVHALQGAGSAIYVAAEIARTRNTTIKSCEWDFNSTWENARSRIGVIAKYLPTLDLPLVKG